jgi:hypothetical protein
MSIYYRQFYENSRKRYEQLLTTEAMLIKLSAYYLQLVDCNLQAGKNQE